MKTVYQVRLIYITEDSAVHNDALATFGNKADAEALYEYFKTSHTLELKELRIYEKNECDLDERDMAFFESVMIARECGVDEDEIIHDCEEGYKFFTEP